MNELLQLISDIIDLIVKGVLSGLSIYVIYLLVKFFKKLIYLLVKFLKKLMEEDLHF